MKRKNLFRQPKFIELHIIFLYDFISLVILIYFFSIYKKLQLPQILLLPSVYSYNITYNIML